MHNAYSRQGWWFGAILLLSMVMAAALDSQGAVRRLVTSEDDCLPLTAGEIAALLTANPQVTSAHLRGWNVSVTPPTITREGNVTQFTYASIRAGAPACGRRTIMTFAANIRQGNSFQPSFRVEVNQVVRPTVAGGDGR